MNVGPRESPQLPGLAHWAGAAACQLVEHLDSQVKTGRRL